jgi:YebC/PmpR family DNA-binding regulatory protein
MSGHSKWASIKHKKQKEDAKRGALFTKLIREITVVARDGGDPDTNPKLRHAVEYAKSCAMPKENIERAIKKGTGELPGVSYEAVGYEGYSPGGAAILVETLTDNKNRTTAEIRHIFSKHGGNLGQTGCVAFMFAEKGILYVDKNETTEDDLINLCIEEGGEDVEVEDDSFCVTTPADKLDSVKSAIEAGKIKYRDAQITKLPKSAVALSDKEGRQALRIMNLLDQHEDVQKVYSNFDIPDELLNEEQ